MFFCCFFFLFFCLFLVSNDQICIQNEKTVGCLILLHIVGKIKQCNLLYNAICTFAGLLAVTLKPSVIRQKRVNLRTGVPRRQSKPNFPKNEHFLPPDTHTYVCVSWGKKCLFFGKFDVLCFLETPF